MRSAIIAMTIEFIPYLFAVATCSVIVRIVVRFFVGD